MGSLFTNGLLLFLMIFVIGIILNSNLKGSIKYYSLLVCLVILLTGCANIIKNRDNVLTTVHQIESIISQFEM